MMEIAIIDDFEQEIESVCCIGEKNEMNMVFKQNGSSISHGQRVVRTFYKYNMSDVKVHMVCIKAIGVIESLKYILNMNLDLVIMCFIIPKSKVYSVIKEWIDLLIKNEIIIISSCSNNANTGYGGFPANYSKVLGVAQGVFLNADEFCFCEKDGYFIRADASPEFLKLSRGKYCLFGGTSKAVPKFAAGLVNALDKGNADKRNIVNYLIKNTKKTNDTLYNECKRGKVLNETDTNLNLLDIIINVTEEYFNKSIKLVHFEDVSLNDIMISEEVIATALKTLFKFFRLRIDLDDLHYSTFMSLHSLAQFIERQGVYNEDEKKY